MNGIFQFHFTHFYVPLEFLANISASRVHDQFIAMHANKPRQLLFTLTAE